MQGSRCRIRARQHRCTVRRRGMSRLSARAFGRSLAVDVERRARAEGMAKGWFYDLGVPKESSGLWQESAA